ncbi:hypothetical protein DFJ77DRAFT_441067 [Powellomyces hirtus]|nr:hypothetical protein DFJ77DRAFT_441067 [Powellomyces hirtus]
MARVQHAKPRTFAFRPAPIILVILTSVALALMVTAYRSRTAWFEQRVTINRTHSILFMGYGVNGVGILGGTLTLKVNLRAFCVTGIPDYLPAIDAIDTGVEADCKPIDMCVVIGDACSYLRIVKDVAVASIATIAASILLSLMLFLHHRVVTPLVYTLLLFTTLATVIADAALLVYFAKLRELIAPEIDKIVASISSTVARFVNATDQGSSFAKPRTFLIVVAALMGAAFLITLFSAVFERCGRRVTSHGVKRTTQTQMTHRHDEVRV